jgi:hypothetical protein
MAKGILCCVLLLALVTAATPAWSGERNDNCEARMGKLDASQAEGADRLAEKNSVIDCCGKQYKRPDDPETCETMRAVRGAGDRQAAIRRGLHARRLQLR